MDFLVAGLHVWSRDGRDISAPRLEDEHLDWLAGMAIQDWHVEWRRAVAGGGDTSRWETHVSRWETWVVFRRPRDAVLWRLRWT